MKNIIDNHLKSLNSVAIDSALSIFLNCFSTFSFSFSDVSVEQLGDWIQQLENPQLDSTWSRQKEMKHPDFILYFAMWHFRNITLHKKQYDRDHQKKIPVNRNYAKETEISQKIIQEINALTVFDGIALLGNLIGAWMLSCPKASILNATSSMRNSQPDISWLRSLFPETLGKDLLNDEIELLYRLDYLLYCTFESVEAHNTE